jgi:hypothetical protein
MAFKRKNFAMCLVIERLFFELLEEKSELPEHRFLLKDQE